MKVKKSYFIIFFIGGPMLIQFLFCLKAPCRYLQANWTAGEILTYIGTIFLGWIAIKQNERLQESNDKAQEDLNRISEKANELSFKSKIIEYELLKKNNIEKCFFDFKEATNSKLIAECFDKNEKKIDTLMVMCCKDMLDSSYQRFILFIENQSEDTTELILHIKKVYECFKEILSILNKNKENEEYYIKHPDILECIKKLNGRNRDLEEQMSKYSKRCQKELDKIIYSNDDVQMRSIY